MSQTWLQEEQRRLTLRAVLTSGLRLQEVWLRYFSLTGNADEYTMDAYLHGLIVLPLMDCDILAIAVNELIDELPAAPRAPYRDELVPHDNDDRAAEWH